MNICLCMHKNICMFLYIYAYIYIYAYEYIQLYMYIYKYVNTYIQIYICIHKLIPCLIYAFNNDELVEVLTFLEISSANLDAIIRFLVIYPDCLTNGEYTSVNCSKVSACPYIEVTVTDPPGGIVNLAYTHNAYI
jgi:hypothetical protein